MTEEIMPSRRSVLLGSFAAGLGLLTACTNDEPATAGGSPSEKQDNQRPTTGTLHVPGAELYYEVRGSGPTLLMISGGLGDASFHSGIAPALAEHYRVVTYDRRGNSRSRLTGTATQLRVAEQTDDAVRLIAATGPDPAYVFGSSAGAIIALDLAIHQPDRVRKVIVHEPPVVTLLPDAAQRRAQFEAVYETYRREGPNRAIREFTALTELDGGAMADPDAGTDPDAGRRVAGNIGFFLEHEMLPLVDYPPDIPAARANSTIIGPARGSASRGHVANLTGTALAERTGTSITDFPGGHTGYLSHAEEFAERLVSVLAAG